MRCDWIVPSFWKTVCFQLLLDLGRLLQIMQQPGLLHLVGIAARFGDGVLVRDQTSIACFSPMLRIWMISLLGVLGLSLTL